MQVEDHVLPFHLLEHRVELLVRDDARVRVRRHAGGIRLDVQDPRRARVFDRLRCDVGMEVEAHLVYCKPPIASSRTALSRPHQKSDVGFNGFEAVLVFESMRDSLDGRNEVRHDHDRVHAALADHRSDQLAHCRAAKMNMCIEGSGELDAIELVQYHGWVYDKKRASLKTHCSL